MSLTNAQILDLVLVVIAVLYLVLANWRLRKIIPIADKFVGTAAGQLALQRNSLKLWSNIPFTCLCFWFVMYRFHDFLSSLHVDPVTTWVIPIFLALYGAYTIFFSISLGLVASSFKRSDNEYKGVL